MGLANIKHILATAVLCSIAFMVYAEEAPVYEVDNYPPPFDQPIDAPTVTPTNSGGTVDASVPANPVFHDSDAPPAVAPPPPRPLTFEQRIQRTEQQIKNLQQSTSFAKTDDLQKEVQTLRGQVEEMAHQLQQAQSQLKTMYADLDKRLAGLQTTKDIVTATVGSEGALSTKSTKGPSKRSATITSASNSSATVKAVSREQPNDAEEQQIYQTAYDLIKAKKYNDAIVTLQKMLQKYPSGQTAANAHYWLGELYSLLNKNEQSANEFSTVIKKYPGSPKVADAQLKLGLIYAGQFKWMEAKSAFKGVVGRYPGTASARLAMEQLKQMKQAGH